MAADWSCSCPTPPCRPSCWQAGRVHPAIRLRTIVRVPLTVWPTASAHRARPTRVVCPWRERMMTRTGLLDRSAHQPACRVHPEAAPGRAGPVCPKMRNPGSARRLLTRAVLDGPGLPVPVPRPASHTDGGHGPAVTDVLRCDHPAQGIAPGCRGDDDQAPTWPWPYMEVERGF